MAYLNKTVGTFDKGIITEIGDEKIPYGSAADNNNWLDLGDRIELVRGQKLIGAEETGSGRVTGLVTGKDTAGNEYMYRVKDTDLQLYNTTTKIWDDVKTDMPDNEDVCFTKYRPTAGSFIIFSGKSTDMGLWRINLADSTSVADFYSEPKNFRGFITVEDNRMWLWNILGAENVLRLSYIDADIESYTQITAENWGTGAPPQVTFTGTAAQQYIVGRSIELTDSVETFYDDGNGTLTGDAGGTGTINYTTGGYSVTFAVAPLLAQAITLDYQYEKPTTHGIFDFTESVPRLAGEGAYLYQMQSDDQIQMVQPYDEKFYVLHDTSIWLVDLTADDTNATNKVFRAGTGVSNWRATVVTGKGIYYADETDAEDKSIKLLKYDKLSSKVEPNTISTALNLDSMVFDDAAGIEFGDFIIWACKSSEDVSYNDTLLLYNKKWELWDKIDGLYRCFTVYGGKLYGGSSVTDNVYQLFTGYDDDDSIIPGVWEANDADLDEEELLKCKKFTVEGEMQTSQNLVVEVNFDQDGWNEVGQISGTGEYVDRSSTYTYGSVLYGSDDYGTGDVITAHRYMREFKFDSIKFDRLQIRFRNTGYGYLNVREYKFKDIRLKGHKLPARFR